MAYIDDGKRLTLSTPVSLINTATYAGIRHRLRHGAPGVAARSLTMTGPDHFILFRDDSGIWCAAPPKFRGLVVDPTGWGDTCEEAIIGLLRHVEFHDGVKTGKWGMPTPVDFVEVPDPDGVKTVEIVRDAVSANIEAAIRRRSFKVISNG